MILSFELSNAQALELRPQVQLLSEAGPLDARPPRSLAPAPLGAYALTERNRALQSPEG